MGVGAETVPIFSGKLGYTFTANKKDEALIRKICLQKLID
jgi:hypothetical protein